MNGITSFVKATFEATLNETQAKALWEIYQQQNAYDDVKTLGAHYALGKLYAGEAVDLGYYTALAEGVCAELEEECGVITEARGVYRITLAGYAVIDQLLKLDTFNKE